MEKVSGDGAGAGLLGMFGVGGSSAWVGIGIVALTSTGGTGGGGKS